jgi:site-specific recombinase XerD
MKNKRSRPLTFGYALKSFMGFLEGTSKAAHTVRSYKSDLATFQQFLSTGLGSKPVDITEIRPADISKYDGYLRTKGLKTNSRRRKILTARRLLKYLAGRRKLPEELGQPVAAPEKIERIPHTFETGIIIKAIAKLPDETELEARNRVLLWVLAETGCRVSEAAKLRFEDWDSSGIRINFTGKFARTVPVSAELFSAVNELRAKVRSDRPWLFFGFNKFGPLRQPITSRGIELLVKAYAERLGYPEMTPRMFRHSVVLRWASENLKSREIQDRLGLKTAYAFRVYQPLIAQLKERT